MLLVNTTFWNIIGALREFTEQTDQRKLSDSIINHSTIQGITVCIYVRKIWRPGHKTRDLLKIQTTQTVSHDITSHTFNMSFRWEELFVHQVIKITLRLFTICRYATKLGCTFSYICVLNA